MFCGARGRNIISSPDSFKIGGYLSGKAVATGSQPCILQGIMLVNIVDGLHPDLLDGVYNSMTLHPGAK